MAKRPPARLNSSRDGDVKLGFGSNVYFGMPAAFPSLDVTVPPTASRGDIYTLTMLVKDRVTYDSEKWRLSLELLESLWDCKAFPENMERREKQWYCDVKAKVRDLNGSCKVCSLHLPHRLGVRGKSPLNDIDMSSAI
jgi:hypothetical protein